MTVSIYGCRAVHYFNAFAPTIATRRSSTLSSLRRKLVTRPHNFLYDFLSPTPQHLLNVALADFLPATCFPPNFVPSNLTLPSTCANDVNSANLENGCHLVYFPTPVAKRSLLPDGTDSLHSPGHPFTRRMWAGGDLFSRKPLSLDCRHAVCVEGIRDVTVKGSDGNERIFVHIERRIGLVGTHMGDVAGNFGRNHEAERVRLWRDDPDDFGESDIIERRKLVFMRERTPTEGERVAALDRIVKAAHSPDFSITLTPDRALLFRFSALTFNAHAIHLDRQYAREREGFRNLLVHGPLTLVLMLTVLASRLAKGVRISSFSYRNLAPLYVDEEMRVCVRKESDESGAYAVWIEGQRGGYAVRGTAMVK